MSALTTCVFRFMRGTTPIGVGVGGPYQGSFRSRTSTDLGTTQDGVGEFLDSPATTSAVTYSVQFLPYNSTTSVIVNNSFNGGTLVDGTVCQSILTIMQC